MANKPQMKRLHPASKKIVQCAMVIVDDLSPGDAALAFLEAAGEIQGRATGAMKERLGSVKEEIRQNHLKLLEQTETASGETGSLLETETETEE